MEESDCEEYLDDARVMPYIHRDRRVSGKLPSIFKSRATMQTSSQCKIQQL